MKKFLTLGLVALVAVLFIAFLFVAPAAAQGGEETPPVATGTPLPENPPTIGTPSPEQTVPISVVELVGEGSKVLYFLIGSLAGGSGVLLSMLVVLRYSAANKTIMAALEYLYKSSPPEIQEGMKVTGQVLTEMSDDVPYAEKPQPVVHLDKADG